MRKNLRNSLRYLYADPITIFSQHLVAAREDESEADEFKDLEGEKAKSAVVQEMKDTSNTTSNLTQEIGQLKDQLTKLLTATAKGVSSAGAGKKPNGTS